MLSHTPTHSVQKILQRTDHDTPQQCALVAELVEPRAAMLEVMGSSPGRTNTLTLKITEEKVLLL